MSNYQLKKQRSQGTKCKGCDCTITCTLAIFCFIVVLAVAAVAVAAIIVDAEQQSVQRYCFNVDNGQILGQLSSNLNSREISWDFQYPQGGGGPMDNILTIGLFGPIPPGQLIGSAPLFVSLCGIPSPFACDTSVSDKVTGIITVNPVNGDSLKTIIQGLRAEPYRYYIEFKTGISTTRVIIENICGTP